MYNFCKKEKIKSLNRQFREIKFLANTTFLRDREIKRTREMCRENKVVPAFSLPNLLIFQSGEPTSFFELPYLTTANRSPMIDNV